ncbi:MAG: hypothetical protein K2K12_06740 [Clostridia bacterium]|nr:hypothetical protein [Clostridia bacterium]
MKKLFTVLALALMTVIMAVTVAGCGTDTAAVDELTNKVNKLTERIEELESKNNVFWTDKKEYSKTDTMTVYFGKTAVFKIRLDNFKYSSSTGKYINGSFYLTNLCADILVDSIATTTYLSWNSGTYMPSWTPDGSIAKKDVETLVRGSYEGDGTAYNNATSFDFVVCVPGTPFELARFKNVSVNK